jgi:hypothetical protein
MRHSLASSSTRLKRATAMYPRLRAAVLVGLAAAAVAALYSMSLVLSLDTCQRVGAAQVRVTRCNPRA